VISVPAEALEELVRRLLQAAGMAPEESACSAEALVWCDRMGRTTQGVWRLPLLVRRLQDGGIRSPCRVSVERTSDSVRLVDGGDGCGYLVGRLAMDEAVAAARAHGAGVAAVRRSNHLGACAYFVERAARSGCIGLALSNSFPKVAPHGGVEPLLGTNPLALGAPRRDGRTVLVDFATAAAAGSTVTKLRAEGRAVPAELVVGSGGGTHVLRSDGPKGFGLALMVEILAGVLTGAGVAGELGSIHATAEPGELGHFFVAFAIERFLPMDAYFERLERLLQSVEASPPADGVDAVRVPGAARWEAARRNADAIGLEPATARALAALAAELGQDVPWS
jgi:ureidoglycolate dehydrogenase (NAD+)